MSADLRAPAVRFIARSRAGGDRVRLYAFTEGGAERGTDLSDAQALRIASDLVDAVRARQRRAEERAGVDR